MSRQPCWLHGSPPQSGSCGGPDCGAAQRCPQGRAPGAWHCSGCGPGRHWHYLGCLHNMYCQMESCYMESSMKGRRSCCKGERPHTASCGSTARCLMTLMPNRHCRISRKELPTLALSVTEPAKHKSAKDQTQPVNSGSCIEGKLSSVKCAIT